MGLYPTGHGWDDAAKLSLAGHAFEKIVDPHRSGLCLMLMGSMNDYRQALEFVKWGLFAEEGDAGGWKVERTIDKELIPPVRKFLIENWESVIALGEILNERKVLSYKEVMGMIQ